MDQEKLDQSLEQAKAELEQLQTKAFLTVGEETEKTKLWKTQHASLIEEAIDELTEKESA